MMTLEINKPRHDRRDTEHGSTVSRNLVLVASGPPPRRDGAGSCPTGVAESSRSQPSSLGPSGLRCTRVPARGE